MKRTILIGAVIMGLLVGHSQAADIKIGVANLQKCFEAYYKTKEADKTLKEAADAYNKERQQLIGDFSKLQEERAKLEEESNKPELAANVKADKKKEADAKLEDLRKQKASIDEFDRVRRQQLQDQSNRMRGNIVKEITDHVVRIAKELSFTLVLDSSGSSMNGTSMVVYSEGNLDITEDVIRELNKNAPPMETPKPAPATKTNDVPESTKPAK